MAEIHPAEKASRFIIPAMNTTQSLNEADHICREAFIQAPLAQVFSYVTDLRNMETFWPEHWRYRRLFGEGGAGTRYGWLYVAAGLPVVGITTIDTLVPGRFEYHTGVPGLRLHVTWQFAEEGTGTRVQTRLRTVAARLPFFARRAGAEMSSALDRLSAALR